MTIATLTLNYAILPVQTHAPTEKSQPPEMSLLRRIQSGDEEALLTLHRQYANLVYSVAYRVLDDQMAAEEVTQDTFLKIWNKGYTFDPDKGQFVTWLLTVTRRLSIDVLRQRQRREPRTGMLFMDEDPSLWENLLPADNVSDLRRTLYSVMNDLPQDQRDLIEMTYFYGLSHSEIAETTGLPLGTVKTRIRLGMQKLRSAWIGEGHVNPTKDN